MQRKPAVDGTLLKIFIFVDDLCIKFRIFFLVENFLFYYFINVSLIFD